VPNTSAEWGHLRRAHPAAPDTATARPLSSGYGVSMLDLGGRRACTAWPVQAAAGAPILPLSTAVEAPPACGEGGGRASSHAVPPPLPQSSRPRPRLLARAHAPVQAQGCERVWMPGHLRERCGLLVEWGVPRECSAKKESVSKGERAAGLQGKMHSFLTVQFSTRKPSPTTESPGEQRASPHAGSPERRPPLPAGSAARVAARHQRRPGGRLGEGGRAASSANGPQ